MKRSRILYIAVIGLILILAAGWAYSVQSHQTEQMEKNIQLVYSFGPNDIGYGKFRQNLEEELKAKGITPRITEFYSNSGKLLFVPYTKDFGRITQFWGNDLATVLYATFCSDMLSSHSFSKQR